MSLMVEFAIFPNDKGESLSPYVARCLQVVAASGLDYRFGPMSTCLESDTWDQALDVVKQCFDKLQADCRRITCTIKIDYRQGPPGRLSSKLDAVERIVGQPLKK